MSFPRLAGAALLLAAAAALTLLPQSAASRQQSPDDAVPAFHDKAPTGPLPSTMAPSSFPDPVVQNAYALAAKIKRVLYQEPCYCHCDRSAGHNSLLDCFASRHGSGCGVCIEEDIYSYEQTRKGKTPAQIREGIIHGDWKTVDLTRYQTPPAAGGKSPQ
ncbi:MAG TPA: CYCXC family (seleno)protein [Candidatus Acidoferrales bacterium]|nr:CYCXC family (seleno)protein [Candidatus Acidoferrales bacterium]